MRLSDEVGIDPQSISFSVGAGAAVGVDDPRLTFSEDFLVYTPAASESYGGYGETVSATLSVSDTLGCRLENHTWSFKLELETVLAKNVVLVDGSSPLKLISVERDTYTFSYSGDSPGISVGDILVSTDPADPYKVKALALTDHPETHTVEVLTELPTLPEIFERASFRFGNAAPEGGQALPLSPAWPWSRVIHIEERLPLDGTVVYEGEHLKVEIPSGFIELLCDLTIGGEIGWPSLLDSFDLDLTGTVSFDATVKATATGEVKREFEKNIFTLPKPIALGFIGPVPIVLLVTLTFDVGMSAQANAQGEITAGISSSYMLSAGVTMRDGNWTPYRAHGADASPVAPAWDVEGAVKLKSYVEAKVAAYVEGLVGPSLDLVPYLEFDGHFRANPLAYDYALYAGVTSDLAIDLSFLRQAPKSWRLLDWRRTPPLLEDTYPQGTELKAQPATWSRTFGGAARDWGLSVRQTGEGGYVLAGWTESSGAGMIDAWLINTDDLGSERWSRTFGGSEVDWAWSVDCTADGGYVLAGPASSFGAENDDVWLIKADALGNEQWAKTFGRGASDGALSVRQTAEGGYVLAGWTYRLRSMYSDALLLKTDALGNREWSRAFGGTYGDWANSAQQTCDGGYILAGFTQSFGAGAFDAWLLKTDAAGNEEWGRTFGRDGYDWGHSVQQTSDGGYILGGCTCPYGSAAGRAWLIKTDGTGNEQWNRTFGGTDQDRARSLQQTSDGGYILAGETRSFGAGEEDAWLVKTDARGNEEWARSFGGAGDDRAFCVQQTTDGGFIVVGYTQSFGAGDADVYLIKTDRFGNAPLPE